MMKELNRWNGIMIFVLFVSLSLAGCAGQAFNKAKQTDTISAYDNFLKEYPDSEYSKEVLKLREKAKEKEELLSWEDAKSRNTISGFDNYLREYPDGKFASDAKKNKELINKLDAINAIQCRVAFNTKGSFLEVRAGEKLIMGPYEAKTRMSGNFKTEIIKIQDGTRSGEVFNGAMKLKKGNPVFETERGDYTVIGYYSKELPQFLSSLAELNRSVEIIGFMGEGKEIEAVCITVLNK